jgi:hypothetical protein
VDLAANRIDLQTSRALPTDSVPVLYAVSSVQLPAQVFLGLSPLDNQQKKCMFLLVAKRKKIYAR